MKYVFIFQLVWMIYSLLTHKIKNKLAFTVLCLITVLLGAANALLDFFGLLGGA